jgi:hypothetical protein
MENLLQNIASGLWIVIGIQVLVWLKRWNKKFSDLYDELKHETGGVHGRWVPFHSEVAGDIQYCSACEIGFAAKTEYCPHCGAKMDGSA